MLSLTRKADYAVMAMAELARRYPERISARCLAESLRVPLPVLTGVLHLLRQADLIGSTLGGRGGYALAREAQDISLAAIVEAIDGPIRLALCCHEEQGVERAPSAACDLEPDCRIKEPVQRVHNSLRSFLQQIRLQHLAFEGQPLNISGSDAGHEFQECGCSGSRSSATELKVEVSQAGSR